MTGLASEARWRPKTSQPASMIPAPFAMLRSFSHAAGEFSGGSILAAALHLPTKESAEREEAGAHSLA